MTPDLKSRRVLITKRCAVKPIKIFYRRGFTTGKKATDYLVRISSFSFFACAIKSSANLERGAVFLVNI